MSEDRDPYATLQVPSSASAEEIGAAYRALARRHHPDVSHEGDAERRMAEINRAWALLRDPGRRAAWDRAHGIGAAAGPGSRGASGSAPGSPATPAHAPTGAATGGAAGAGGSRFGAGGSRPGAVAWRRGPNGEGSAGPPPGNPRGSVLPFGRHIGWSLGEIARVDPGYLVWLQGRREGAPYQEEIERLLAAFRARAAGSEAAPPKRGRLR